MNTSNSNKPLVVSGDHLNLLDIINVSRGNLTTEITQDDTVHSRLNDARNLIQHAVENDQPIYGVTSGFGGLAHIPIAKSDVEALQNNIPWFHQVGTGKLLPPEIVRAAILLLMNSLLKGISGVRVEIIERLNTFLNNNATPQIYDLVSIGASGDLSPLSYIAGCLIGSGPSWKMNYQGKSQAAISVLQQLDLQPMRLQAKEGLAIANGTAVMTSIAAHSIVDAKNCLHVAMGAHALLIQGLAGTNQSFHAFIHQSKPHPGQLWAARTMLDLLQGSQLIEDALDGQHQHRDNDLIQDRYSLRCLPQFMGPIVEGIDTISGQIEIEANSVTDNPLIDSENNVTFHGGNFLGQYVGVGMDQLRHYIALLSKHLDVQIAITVNHHFNKGLPPLLVGNPHRKYNSGLQGLQIASNSLAPLLSFYANPLTPHFPTHAENYNQNINSQGFGSANLARQSVAIFQQQLAMSLMFGIQAVDLRTFLNCGHYDARETLSPKTLQLYNVVKGILGVLPSQSKPYIWNDDEQVLEHHIAALTQDLHSFDSEILKAMIGVGV